MNVERSPRISISKVNLTQRTLDMLSVCVNKPHFEGDTHPNAGNAMKGKILFGALTTAACGALVAAPAKAGTIYIGASANGSTITTQNAGTPGTSFDITVGGFALPLVSGGDPNPVDLTGGTTNGKNWSGTAKFWAPLSETGLRTANSAARFHQLYSERPGIGTGDGSTDSTMEATSVPELWTWVLIGLGFAGVGVLRLIRPRRKQPRYIT